MFSSWKTLEKLIIYVDQQMSNTATDLIFNAVKQSKSLKSFENVACKFWTRLPKEIEQIII